MNRTPEGVILQAMSTNPRDTVAVERIAFSATPNLLDAVRTAARQRNVTVADYVRTAVECRMILDGTSFPASRELSRTFLKSIRI